MAHFSDSWYSAALYFTSKTQVNSPASNENDGEGQNSVAIEESNEVPLKPKRGRKPGNKVENVEGSKKRQRSSSTGLKEELEVFELTRFEFDSLLDRLVKSELNKYRPTRPN